MPRADALSHSQNFAFFGRRDAAERGPTRRSSPFLDTRRLTTQENIEIAAVPKLPVAGWDQKFTGANALVLIQVLAGGRERSWMTAGEEENMPFGQVENLRQDAIRRNKLLTAIEYHEHVMVIRAKQWGMWSDAMHASEQGYVRVSHILELVSAYNHAAAQRFAWSLASCGDILRKALRLVSDAGMVGNGKLARKVRAETLISFAMFFQRKGKLNEAMRVLNRATVITDGLLQTDPECKLPDGHVAPNSLFCFRMVARGLLNLDKGGASDPFLRLARLSSKARERWIEGKNAKLGKEIGKTVHKTPVVMNDLDPVFAPFQIDAQRLNGGDLARPLHISVFDCVWPMSMLAGVYLAASVQ